ncbi:MAG: ATP-binding protein [Deltaproteobacteria bacterium]
MRARACEAFFTTKQAGRGLGLALVRQIALVHGAQLEIDSEPGRGSLVRLRFLPAT